MGEAQRRWFSGLERRWPSGVSLLAAAVLVAAVAAQAWLLVAGPARLEARAVEVYEGEQARAAEHAAGRIGVGLAEVRRRVESSRLAGAAPASPRGWLERVLRPWDPEQGVVWFVHDADGRILDLDPRFPQDRRGRFLAHLHLDGSGPDHAHGDVSVCRACLEHLDSVSLSVPLDERTFLTANVDVRKLAGPTLHRLVDAKGASAWLLDRSGRVLVGVGQGSEDATPGDGFVVSEAPVPHIAEPWRLRVAAPRAAIAPAVGVEARHLLLASLAVLAAALLGTVLFFRRERRLRADVLAQARRHDATKGELRSLTERYAVLFRSTHDPILIFDADGRVVDANPKAVEQFGWPERDLLGKSVLELHPADARDEARRVFGYVRADGYVRAELPCVTRTGERFVGDLSAARSAIGGTEMIHSVVRDITARLEMQSALEESRAQLRQSQKMEAIGRLAGGVAHDFNNLLSVILANAQFITEDGEGIVAEDAREILDAARRASGLTGQLLAFSRRQVLVPSTLGLNDVIEEIEKLLRRLLGEDVDLVTSLEADPSGVFFDRTQLEQIVMNLAVNARQAMPEGGRLTIATRNATVGAAEGARRGVEPGDYVVLEVEDQGCGMDEQTAARAFEPFFTTKGRGEGTGLGLSTVYGIVRQSGGSITVESEVGAGTTFRIHVPVHADADEPRLSAPPAPRRSPGGETVLLVEDEPGVRKLVGRILAREGYRVLEAEDGVAAKRLWAEHGPAVDLVLTDVVMPKMSGSALVAELIADRASLRVVYMTGHTDDALVRHGVRDGQVRVLHKPVVAAVLVRTVREVIDGRPVPSRRPPAIEMAS